MISKDVFKTQEIDEQLLDSLDRLQPAGTKPMFPTSKGKFKKPKITHEKPVETPIEPQPAPVGSAIKPPRAPFRFKRYLLLFIPSIFLLIIVVVAIIASSIGSPLIPSSIESGLYTTTVILILLSHIALTFYFLGELRQRYIVEGSTIPVATRDIQVVAIFLLIWPLILLTVLCTVFFVSIGNTVLLNTLGGLSFALILTGTLAVVFGGLILFMLYMYRRGSDITYPPYIYEAIDFVWRHLH